jgi:hypothetical protein
MGDFYSSENKQHITACKQYCLAAGATQGSIAYTQNVMGHWVKASGLGDIFKF